MSRGEPQARTPVTVIVGVDGSGRTHRLERSGAVAGDDVVRIGAGVRSGEALDDLLARAAAGAIVLVDDAHRLETPVLTALVERVRAGTRMVMARRPRVERAELAELDAELALRGTVERLGPLGLDEIASVLAAGPGAADPRQILARSCGVAAVVAALALARDAGVPAVLVARVQRALVGLDAPAVAVAQLLALELGVSDDLLAAAAGVAPAAVGSATVALRDAGLLDPSGESLIPAMAEALRVELPPAVLRARYDAVAGAVLAAGGDVLSLAARLRAARVRTAAAASVFTVAADQLRFRDPAAAVNWCDDAVDAGADPAQVALVKAEAGAALGIVADVDLDLPVGEDQERLARVDGVLLAYQGRPARAADVLLVAGELGRLLAVPALVASGQWGRAQQHRAVAGPVALRRLAEAALAIAEPDAAVALFIEAAETFERHPPAAVVVDTPQALAASVAVLVGDGATAETLLVRAVRTGVGGPVAVTRHRLLLAWVRMRTGRFDTASAELAAGTAAVPHGRDRLLVAALEAGLARRSGDIARMRAAWGAAEQALARRAVDLFGLESWEELLVAAARLGQGRRIEPVLSALDAAVAGVGDPVCWRIAVGWIRLQVAVAGDDAAAVGRVADELGMLAPSGPRQQAQVAAARSWAEILLGRVDAEQVTLALSGLAAVQLPWEASRLAGQAAIRSADPTVARRLLERARDLSSADPAASEPGTTTPAGGLSDREVEVARLVMAGRTHREIGSQLFLSPKTVEHHVARIRTKLGATTRAEFLAALRKALGSADESA